MPRISFSIAGMPDVMRALDNLTPELVNDVERMQKDAAEQAAATIRSRYVYRTGALVKGVRVRRLLKGRVVAAHIVENTYWLASVYETGTKTVRETKQGYSRGQMPSRKVFFPVVNEMQRIVHQRTREILQRHGLFVRYAAA